MEFFSSRASQTKKLAIVLVNTPSGRGLGVGRSDVTLLVLTHSEHFCT